MSRTEDAARAANGAWSIAMLIARYAPAVGGAEGQCRRLSEALAGRGHRVTILTEAYEPHLAPRETMNGVDVVRFRTAGKPPLSSLLYTLRAGSSILRAPAFDLFHAHLLSAPAVLAAAMGLALRTPALLKIAGARQTGDVALSRGTLRGRAKLWALKRMRPYWVGPSEETVREAIVIGAPAERCAVIPNGVDLREFGRSSDADRAPLRERLGLPVTGLIALFSGRWVPGKGVERLLRIWERPSIAAKNWTLLLMLPQKPENQAALDEARRRLGSRLQVVIAATKLADYYRASDVAVLLSEGEGLSNFIIEAMACGLPALCTPAALPKTAEKGAAFSWSVASDEGVESTLTGEAADPDIRRAKGAAARSAAERFYSLDAVASAYEHLYARMLRRAE